MENIETGVFQVFIDNTDHLYVLTKLRDLGLQATSPRMISFIFTPARDAL